MTETSTVLVVGAGPTGLTLAATLAEAGISVRIIDRRPQRSPWSRAFGLMPRTLELLHLRGQAEPFVEAGLPCRLAPIGDLRGHLDYEHLDSPFPYILILPQQRTEDLLEAWAVKSGAQLSRGVALTGLRQDANGVDVTLSDNAVTWEERVDVVVGCDGVQSSVRGLLGIPFAGRSYEQSLVIADVHLADAPDPPVYAQIAPRGMVATYPFGDGTYRLIVLDRTRMGVPLDEPVTLEELSASCLAITGRDFRPHDAVWLSRFRSSQRQAARYRAGRVLLAGDAAHTHIPSGGQGLQVGIQDAFNLSWKLAAHLAGWAPPGLLDSYERERHPVATDTLRKTDLAFRFETSNAPGTAGIRRLIAQAMHIPALQVPVMEQFAGLTLRYDRGAGQRRDRMIGRRLPETSVRNADGEHALSGLFHEGRYVLIDQSAAGSAARTADHGWADRVRTVSGKVPPRRSWPEVVLARPDGYVAWGGRATEDAALTAALRAWCGRPGPDRTPESSRDPRPEAS